MVPQTNPQHSVTLVTAGCHPLSLGHRWGPGDALVVLWAHCCSPLSCRVVGTRRADHPISWSFRLTSLRCPQCPVFGLSKGLCAFQNVDIQRHLLPGIDPLGQVARKAG